MIVIKSIMIGKVKRLALLVSLKSIDYKIAKAIVKASAPSCHEYFISSFFDPKIKKKYRGNTRTFSPIIRPKLFDYKVSEDDHFVVSNIRYEFEFIGNPKAV